MTRRKLTIRGVRPAALVIAGALTVGGLAAGGWLAAAPASAAAQDPACSGGQCTVSFTSPGTGQSFTVPAGVTSLSVALYGGRGGTNEEKSAPGGDGAEVSGALAVTAGQVLGVDVGGAGAGGAGVVSAAGGVNGGGSSHSGGGGGGGATDVTSAGTPLLVAGGGGGAGGGQTGTGCLGDFFLAGGAGGNADTPGGAGQQISDSGLTLGGGGGGDAGSLTGPGAGGLAGGHTGSSSCTGVSVSNGSPGTSGSGSSGGSETASTEGGGGGGGYTGGGGGAGGATETEATPIALVVDASAASGGGGGGSSYTGGAGVSNAAVSDTGNSGQVNSGNGEVVLGYADPVATGAPAYSATAGQTLTVPAASGLASSTAGTTAPAGDTLTASGPATTSAGGTLTVNSDGSFSYTPPTGFTGSDTFTYTITDSLGDYATGTATIAVQSLAQTVTFSTTAPQDAVYGGSYTPAASASSGLLVSFTIDDSSAPGACALSGTTVDFTGTGSCVIDANQSGNSSYAAAPQVQQSFIIGAATPGVQLSVTPVAGSATVSSDVQLSVTVVGVAGGVVPAGSVSFTVDGGPASCGPVTLDSTGQGSCDLGELPSGGYSFGATYGGGTDYGTASATAIAGYPVSLLPQTVSFTTSPPSPAEFGGSYTPAATGGGSGNAVTFTATGACTASSGTVAFTGTGTCTVTASQAGTSSYAAGTGQQSFPVSAAVTRTTVRVTGSALTTTVTAVPPGAGTPSGTVTFAVGGATVGTATLNAAGTASLPYVSSGAETVSAAYAGNDDYLASSASTATSNPVITARLSGKYPKSTYGWYRSPVTVTFACTAGSAPLTGSCPNPVTLTRNGASQVVTRTIHGTDGGIATVSVVVSIDQTAPQLTVTGIKNKASYDAPGPAKVACTATEKISGLAAPCKLTVHRTAAAITWIATATSKAGITTTVKGKAALTDFYLAGVPLRHGRYLVALNHTYTVIAYLPGSTEAPRYVYAAPQGVKPHPVGPKMTKIGPGLWAIRTTITTLMDRKYENWTLGILEGHTLHIILITLQR